MYNRGHGVVQSYKEGLAWYRKAAAQGHADAQCDQGDMYVQGQGVP